MGIAGSLRQEGAAARAAQVPGIGKSDCVGRAPRSGAGQPTGSRCAGAHKRRASGRASRDGAPGGDAGGRYLGRGRAPARSWR